MKSEIERSPVNVGILEVSESNPRGFALFEEFCGRSVSEVYAKSARMFEASSAEGRARLCIEAEAKVKDFRDWLVNAKGYRLDAAHYFSVSVKSLIAGLPIGVEIGLLFAAALDKFIGEIEG
jgi:hypothetical protein